VILIFAPFRTSEARRSRASELHTAFAAASIPHRATSRTEPPPIAITQSTSSSRIAVATSNTSDDGLIYCVVIVRKKTTKRGGAPCLCVLTPILIPATLVPSVCLSFWRSFVRVKSDRETGSRLISLRRITFIEARLTHNESFGDSQLFELVRNALEVGQAKREISASCRHWREPNDHDELLGRKRLRALRERGVWRS
jgi:hypothetical protein